MRTVKELMEIWLNEVCDKRTTQEHREVKVERQRQVEINQIIEG